MSLSQSNLNILSNNEPQLKYVLGRPCEAMVRLKKKGALLLYGQQVGKVKAKTLPFLVYIQQTTAIMPC